MTNYTRKHQKVFASSAVNNGQFGSLQTGAKVQSTDPEVLQNLAAYEAGWNSATASGEKLPPLEEFQGLQYKTDYQIAYLLQKGFAEWNTATNYYIGDLTREIGGTKIYKSLTDDNQGNSLTDVVNWVLLADLATLGEATTSQQGFSYLPQPITISNNATDSEHDINFSVGVIDFDDGSGQAVMPSTLTKQIDQPWAAGTNQGGMDDGTVAPNTWYYGYVIHNPTSGVKDAVFTATYGSPTMPTGFTKKQYRGAIRTDGSANIREGSYIYNPDGSYKYYYDVMIVDRSLAAMPTAPTNLELSVPPNNEAMVNYHAEESSGGGNRYVLFTETNSSNKEANSSNFTLFLNTPGGALQSNSGYGNFLTDSSSEISIDANSTGVSVDVRTVGWIDNLL